MTTLTQVREAVVAGLEFYETVKDNPEYGGDLVDAIADSVIALEAKPLRGAAGTGDETTLTLAQMQSTQPWTAPYSEHFETSKRAEPHRSLMHDLMHVTKAVGVLASIAEWADHGSVRTERIDQAEYEGRIADLVMCALHMANNPPQGYAAFVLHRAVVDRVERVNGVKWPCETVRILDGENHG